MTEKIISEEILNTLSFDYVKSHIILYSILDFIAISVIVFLIVFCINFIKDDVSSVNKMKKAKKNKKTKIKNKSRKVRKTVIEFSSLVCLMIAIITMISIDMPRYIDDFRNKSAIVYYGTYRYEHCNTRYDRVILGNGEQIFCSHIFGPDLEFNNKYNGYVIYSEKTKALIDYGDKAKADKIKAANK